MDVLEDEVGHTPPVQQSRDSSTSVSISSLCNRVATALIDGTLEIIDCSRYCYRLLGTYTNLRLTIDKELSMHLKRTTHGAIHDDDSRSAIDDSRRLIVERMPLFERCPF